MNDEEIRNLLLEAGCTIEEGEPDKDALLERKMHVLFARGKITLYDVLTLFMRMPRPMPEWVVDAVETGFQDRIEGKRDLDQVFGLTPRPSKQLDKSARRLTYAPAVYWEVVRRNEAGEAIDMALFEAIAEEMAPTFKREWPNTPPPGGSTLKKWYDDELKVREPEKAEARNRRKKTKAKTD